MKYVLLLLMVLALTCWFYVQYNKPDEKSLKQSAVELESTDPKKPANAPGQAQAISAQPPAGTAQTPGKSPQSPADKANETAKAEQAAPVPNDAAGTATTAAVKSGGWDSEGIEEGADTIQESQIGPTSETPQAPPSGSAVPNEPASPVETVQREGKVPPNGSPVPGEQPAGGLKHVFFVYDKKIRAETQAEEMKKKGLTFDVFVEEKNNKFVLCFYYQDEADKTRKLGELSSLTGMNYGTGEPR
jgi:hypothetical protein